MPTSIGFRMKLIQDYIYYDFISHAALRVKMIARFKKNIKNKDFLQLNVDSASSVAAAEY